MTAHIRSKANVGTTYKRALGGIAEAHSVSRSLKQSADAIAMFCSATRKAGASAARHFFAALPTNLRANLAAIQKALRRATAARHRLEAQRARHDTREWVVKRRERTRHLIELGGLVRKSGLVDLTGDDRAVLYGAFLEIASMLQSKNREQNMAFWRSRGSGAFKKSETDAA